jgi:CDP-glucose 4,6-dehydratase
MIFNDVYRGKKVLVTGHTGFKGSWLTIWLQMLGAEVTGYALPPDTDPSMFVAARLAERICHIEADIRDSERIGQVISETKPEIIFHLAAQPLVRKSYAMPHLTYETNVMGTVNLLEAIRKAPSVKACLIITSDKCYENKEWEYAYRENDPLGGFDPYSSSKAAAELVVAAYRNSFFDRHDSEQGIKIASARAGNVIGGGDWAQDRIIPDVIRSLAQGKPVAVRNPNAIRPWQHVLEPLAGYLWLTALMLTEGNDLAEAWNFGPDSYDCLTVSQLVEGIIDLWGSGQWEDVSNQDGLKLHESKYLQLDCAKTQRILGWSPVYRIADALQATLDWYRHYYTSPVADIYDISIRQLNDYVESARGKSFKWTGRVE